MVVEMALVRMHGTVEKNVRSVDVDVDAANDVGNIE